MRIGGVYLVIILKNAFFFSILNLARRGASLHIVYESALEMAAWGDDGHVGMEA